MRSLFLIIFGLIGFFVGILCFGLQILAALVVLLVTALFVGL